MQNSYITFLFSVARPVYQITAKWHHKRTPSALPLLLPSQTALHRTCCPKSQKGN